MKSKKLYKKIKYTGRKFLKELWASEDVYGLCKIYFRVTLTPLQERIVSCVAFDHHPRTVISCMTRYGKSYSVALGILLWIISNVNKKIIIIAPTNEKTSIIRNYLSHFVTQSTFFMQQLDLDKTGTERIKKEVSRKRMTWKNGVEMRTLSAEGKGEALMGFGADKVIVDEECDIDYETYRSKITRMLGDHPEDSTYVGIGNPWHRDNQMYQHWINPNWYKIYIDWKIALKENRITAEFINEQRTILTPREFQVLYDAEFPEESEDQLIKYFWIQRAIRPIENLQGQKILGVDVARTGIDSTVLTFGRETDKGEYLVEGIKEYNQQDTMQTVGKILELNKEYNFDRITIDTSGLGAGVTDRLKEAKNEGRIKGKIVAYEGGKSSLTDFKRKTQERKEIKTRFLNMKAEAYFKLRDLFEENKIIIPKHHKLINQLTKMKWELTSSEKIHILGPGEAEGDTAEKKSPDFADSLCYFCWGGIKSGLIFGSLDIK